MGSSIAASAKWMNRNVVVAEYGNCCLELYIHRQAEMTVPARATRVFDGLRKPMALLELIGRVGWSACQFSTH